MMLSFFNEHKKVNLSITEEVLQKIKHHALSNYPNECGGFFLGKYSENLNTLEIQDILLPISSNKSSYLFERSIQGLEKIFLDYFQQKNLYYVGEWHTHPNGSSQYSHIDLNAMHEIVACKTVSITNPIMMILSVSKNQVNDFTIYLYDKKGLYKYGEC